MPLFKYDARDYNMKKISGEINASNDKDARLLLKQQDLIVINIKEIKSGKSGGTSGGFNLNIELTKPKVKLDEITLFSRQFATLIESGVPISKSLYILSDNTKDKNFKKILVEITQDIESGTSLSDSLGKHSHAFPQIYIDMVEAAEISGALPEVLNRLATYMENDKSMKAKVKSAFIYPISVICIAFLVVVVMMIFVIPQFEPLFADLGEDLPLPTKVLMGLSNFLVESWLPALIGIILAAIGLTIYSKTKLGKRHMDWLKLKVPILGTIATKSAVARFSRTLETLQRSGVPLVQSLSIVGKTSGNYLIEKAMVDALKTLESGGSISEPLEKSKLFPPLVTQMIKIGEETGELEKLLSKIADFYEEEVDQAVKNLTALIEPIITIFLGVVVGFIALSIIMPIYNMMGAMQNQ